MVQAFLTQFPEFEPRDPGLFIGGHYVPEFAYYFEQQNAAIDAGTITDEKINLIALGINNGWIDPRKFPQHDSKRNMNPRKEEMEKKY